MNHGRLLSRREIGLAYFLRVLSLDVTFSLTIRRTNALHNSQLPNDLVVANPPTVRLTL